MNNTFFINQLSSEIRKPFILSCGMAYEKEIKNSVSILIKKKIPFILLKCTSLYPAKDLTLNLQSLKTLRNKFKCIVGYSDHSTDNLSCLVAVSNGAKVIEKHFNIEKNKNAPDDIVSAKPKQFAELIKNIRRVEKILGSSKIYPDKSEINKRNHNLRNVESQLRIS